MCRGEDQGLLERQMMPSLSICRNSFFAAASFLPSRQRNRHAAALGDDMMLYIP
jgi:hypothetical protein